MGLDITAYRRLTPLPDVHPAEDEELPDDQWMPGASMDWSESHWPGRGEGVDPRTVYTFAESFRFRAGSYGGYNAWRDRLARVAGHRSARAAQNRKTGPFVELLNFADNGGVIGPVVSAKLAADFASHETKAEAMAEGDDMEGYRAWRRAFEMAADGGAVDFH